MSQTLRVLTPSGPQYYDEVTHSSSLDKNGCLTIKNQLSGKVVKAYSSSGWLEVGKESTIVDSVPDPYE